MKGGKCCDIISDNKFRGLKSVVHLAEGAQVMLTQNISAPLGLGNGTTSAVQDIVFVECAEASSPTDYAWIDCGGQYKGHNLICGQSGANIGGDQSIR
jgi:hypothetical protein